MILQGPLLFGLLLTIGVLTMFVGLWRTIDVRDPVEARLKELGMTKEAAADEGRSARKRQWTGINRLLNGFGLGPSLALSLTRAAVPLTAAEFAVISLLLAMLGLLVGSARAGLFFGILLALLGMALPLVYLRTREARRKRAFTQQLPDVLTLMIGALKAGYGLSQALDMLVERVRPPASQEFRQATRAIALGVPIQSALNELADRVGSDDLDMVVSAMNVQYEMGGDLAQTLSIIAETVRERIRMAREIRSLTAQQRLTGYVLAVLPAAFALIVFMVQPAYMLQLFQPGVVRLIPIGAVVLQVVGFLLIQRIVDIEV